jgi:hypothetical protein
VLLSRHMRKLSDFPSMDIVSDGDNCIVFPDERKR